MPPSGPVPGPHEPVLVRDYKGKNAGAPVYRVDTALIAELRALMRQAAEEMGQWVERHEDNGIDLVELLNAGRERARRAALEEAAFQEAKERQALNAGVQTAA